MLLEAADLQMKHDFYKAMDPKTDLGKRYWAALPKESGRPCMPGPRNWIGPKPVQVCFPTAAPPPVLDRGRGRSCRGGPGPARPGGGALGEQRRCTDRQIPDVSAF
ncbi:hypothetical protein QA802_05680 [Streptomyces sp. B21-105]|uniref:hypothetical protein n=1 Tax=Streptomyces sp. B21-105 TaxID=3039417 RepID=UPI002FF37619